MKRPLLSFCIPVYNMGKFIPNLIDSIVYEVSKYKEYMFEICISDNDSSDNTNSYFSSLSIEIDNLNLVYCRNASNIGADKNFINAVNISSGVYCWLLGGDDILLSGSLGFILNEICENNNIDIFLGDRQNIDIEGKYISDQYWSDNYRIIDYEFLLAYLNSLRSIGGIFSYLSCILFKKESWDNSINSIDVPRFIGGNYIHAVILLNIIKCSGRMKYLHYIIVKARRGNDSFLDRGYLNRIKIDYGYIDIFDYIFNDIDLKISIRKLLRRERRFSHFLKASGLSGKLAVYKFMKKEKIYSRFLIVIIPMFFVKFLLFFYRGLNENSYCSRLVSYICRR